MPSMFQALCWSCFKFIKCGIPSPSSEAEEIVILKKDITVVKKAETNSSR